MRKLEIGKEDKQYIGIVPSVEEENIAKIFAEGVDVEICGRKECEISIRLSGDADVSYDICCGNILLIFAKRNGVDGDRPKIKVYFPIDAGVSSLTVDALDGDIIVNSVVKRQFVEDADLTVKGCGDLVGDIEDNIIKHGTLRFDIDEESF